MRTGRSGYAERKGIERPESCRFTPAGWLLVPAIRYDLPREQSLKGLQVIRPDGTKRFTTGMAKAGAACRLGLAEVSDPVLLCEGYATALSIASAIRRLPGAFQVLVCFSAQNLERVGQIVPRNAVVAADNDRSGTGERAACATGLRWTMPYEVATDFNDLHQAMGLHVVTERMRELFAQSMPA